MQRWSQYGTHQILGIYLAYLPCSPQTLWLYNKTKARDWFPHPPLHLQHQFSGAGETAGKMLGSEILLEAVVLVPVCRSESWGQFLNTPVPRQYPWPTASGSVGVNQRRKQIKQINKILWPWPYERAERNRKIPSQNMSLWPRDYFELKSFENKLV